MHRVYEFYKLIYTTPRDAVKFAQFLSCSASSCDYYSLLLHENILPLYSEELKIYSAMSGELLFGA